MNFTLIRLVVTHRYTPTRMLTIVLKSVLFSVNTHLKVPRWGVSQLTQSDPLFLCLLMPSFASLLWALIHKEQWVFHGLTLTSSPSHGIVFYTSYLNCYECIKALVSEMSIRVNSLQFRTLRLRVRPPHPWCHGVFSL